MLWREKRTLVLRDAVVELQHDDARHADGAIDGVDDVTVVAVLVGLRRQLRPAREVEGLELGVDDARDTQVEQRERAPDVGDVDRLVVPIEHQDGGVGHPRNIAGRVGHGKTTVGCRKRSGPVSGLKFPGFEHSARLGARRRHRQLRDRRLGPPARAAPRRARPLRDVRLQHRRFIASLSFVAKRFESPLVGLGVAAGRRSRCRRRRSASSRRSSATRPGRRRSAARPSSARAVFYSVLLFSRFIEPLHTTTWFGIAFLAYVFAGLYLSVFYLYQRYRATPSRVEKTRLLYLLVGGFATVTAVAARGACRTGRASATSSSSSTSTSCRRTWSATGCSISTSCSAAWSSSGRWSSS